MLQAKASTASSSGSGVTSFSPLCLTMIAAAVTERLIKRVWLRIWGTRSADKTPPTPPSSATRLPQEIVEMIIGYIIYDEPSLLACSLTCYSWYIASIPHLHHTLVTSFYWRVHEPKHTWFKSLRNMDKFSLLPLVKKFQVREGAHLYHCASPRIRFNCRTLCHFWTLANVRELGIECLDIPSIMPKIRQYFKHFLPSVRSLSLRSPKGSNRHTVLT